MSRPTGQTTVDRVSPSQPDLPPRGSDRGRGWAWDYDEGGRDRNPLEVPGLGRPRPSSSPEELLLGYSDTITGLRYPWDLVLR